MSRMYQKVISEGKLTFRVRFKEAEGEMPARCLISNPDHPDDPIYDFIIIKGEKRQLDIEIEVAPLTIGDSVLCTVNRVNK